MFDDREQFLLLHARTSRCRVCTWICEPHHSCVHFAMNPVTSVTVACGFSSMIQWPEAGTMPPVTSLATNRSSSAIPEPKNFCVLPVRVRESLRS
jgi:hypothetical protein